MNRQTLLFLLITLVFFGAISTNITNAQNNEWFGLENSFPKLLQNKFQPFTEKFLQDKQYINATGDFLVTYVDGYNGSYIEREVKINGVVYKATVSNRRAQMTTKLNIPLQGVVYGNTIILDDNPGRIINASEYAALGVEINKLSGESLVAQVGGKVLYFSSIFEYSKFINEQILW